MALKVLNKNSTLTGGTYVAADWDTVTNTPGIHATTNINNINSVTPSYTATFTAPNTTNACTGVWIYAVSGWDATCTMTATLYENAVATVCTKTISATNWRNGGWMYFKFATPYVFTATTAGYYKFGINSLNNGVDVGADAAGTAIAFVATDNRTGAPGATDDLWVGGSNGTTATLTLSGTNSWGSATDTTYKGTTRSVGYALMIGAGGIVQEDITTTNSTTIIGIAGVNPYGEWYRGTVANPMGVSVTSTLIFSMSATDKGGYVVVGYGKLVFQGSPKTYWRTKYASGNGTTATPMITADTTGWAINDELRILATSDSATNYAETESKFIKTISGTSITLSDTAGGGEAGLSYTHTTDAWILNITYNVKSTTNNAAYFGWAYHNAQSEFGYVDVDWASYRYFNNSLAFGSRTYVDNSAFGYSFSFNYGISSGAANTFSNLISHNAGSSSAASSGAAIQNCKSTTFNNCFFIQSYYTTLYMASNYSTTFNDCVICSAGLGSTSSYGLYMVTANMGIVFNRLQIGATRGASASYSAISVSAVGGVTFNDCEIGTKGAIKYFLNQVTSTFNDVLFNDCNLGTYTNFISTNSPLDGSIIKFHKFNSTDYYHYWYTPYGIAYATGSGLTDTTTRTVGNYALRIDATDATDGFTYEFDVLAQANQLVSIPLFIWQNATFVADAGASVVVELYMPGSATPDATKTMTLTADNTSNNANATISFSNTLDIDGYATVKIIVKTVTSGAYCYVADPFNGTNAITGMRVWKDGQPSSVMFEQLGDSAGIANAVWGITTATQTVAGTMGKKLAKQPFLIDESGYVLKG